MPRSTNIPSTFIRPERLISHGIYFNATTLPYNAAVTISKPPTAKTLNQCVQIPNNWSNRLRKQIVFTVSVGGGGNVIILTEDLRVFCVVTSTSPLTFETDALFYAYTDTNALDLIVGEIYYRDLVYSDFYP
jgi:hypothetical protein